MSQNITGTQKSEKMYFFRLIKINAFYHKLQLAQQYNKKGP